MTQHQQQSKRAFERFQSDMAIWVKTNEPHAEFVLVEITNIGAGGLLFLMDHQLETNSSLEIRFELPQITDLVEAKAAVRHVKEDDEEPGMYRIGVQFLEVKNFSIAILMAYLEALYI